MLTLELKRIGDEVYFGDTKLSINKQATKGEHQETVRINKLPKITPEGVEQKKWYALSKLQEGVNILTPDMVVSNAGGCEYTPEEEELVKEYNKQIAELQEKLDELEKVGKARYKETHAKDTKASKKSSKKQLTLEEQVNELIASMGRDKAIEYMQSILNGKESA